MCVSGAVPSSYAAAAQPCARTDVTLPPPQPSTHRRRGGAAVSSGASRKHWCCSKGSRVWQGTRCDGAAAAGRVSSPSCSSRSATALCTMCGDARNSSNRTGRTTPAGARCASQSVACEASGGGGGARGAHRRRKRRRPRRAAAHPRGRTPAGRAAPSRAAHRHRRCRPQTQPCTAARGARETHGRRQRRACRRAARSGSCGKSGRGQGRRLRDAAAAAAETHRRSVSSALVLRRASTSVSGGSGVSGAASGRMHARARVLWAVRVNGSE